MSRSEYGRWLHFISENAAKIEVDDGANGEHAEVVICRLVTSPLLMKDNLVGHCSKCFRMIQFRPHVPKTPKRLCDECGALIIDEHMKNGEELGAIITPATAADLALFIRKKGLH